MDISINLHSIKPITKLSISISTQNAGLTCIVGKNGTGKTTLIKSIQNLINPDTFKRTSPENIFSEDSSICYTIDNQKFDFIYDPNIRSLNCNNFLDKSIAKKIGVELSMPFGQRFSSYQNISKDDADIRKCIVLEQYSNPAGLISFLKEVYPEKDFSTLVQVDVNKRTYYCIPLDENKYIREDHLSSAEYFVIGIYRKLITGCELIAIDEIDISLDASAQVRLINLLRKHAQINNTKIFFTTHSLPMIKTLQYGELFYLAIDNGNAQLSQVSYAYIKSVLFGFLGYDKYILTEDKMLASYVEYVIQNYCEKFNQKYIVIHIGGAGQVCSLRDRNIKERFLSDPHNVVCILDGDQNKEKNKDDENIIFLPYENIEYAIYHTYQNPKIPPHNPPADIQERNLPKNYFRHLMHSKITIDELFLHVCLINESKLENFKNEISDFIKLQPA